MSNNLKYTCASALAITFACINTPSLAEGLTTSGTNTTTSQTSTTSTTEPTSTTASTTAILTTSANTNAVSGTSTGSFINADFETGDFTGWNITGGYWSNGWPIPPAQYSGTPLLASIVPKGTIDSVTGVSAVFSGNYSLKLNDEYGDNHLTAASQTVTNFGSNKIYFAWNAILEPSHGADDSPSFLIEVVDLTTGQTVQYVSYSAYSAQNSSIFRTAGSFVTSDWKAEEIDVIAGHDYKITVLGADCLYGGHGGYVYLDSFGGIIPTANFGVAFNPLTDITHGTTDTIPVSGITNIDLSRPVFNINDVLNRLVNPVFAGGVFQVIDSTPISQSFTVLSAGGTIDTQGFSTEFSGGILGTGDFNFIGGGKITLSGGADILGTTNVNNTNLLLLSNYGTGAGININTGAKLSGTGNVTGDIFVNNGGRLDPGDSIGTLSATGNVKLNTGGFFHTDIDGKLFNPAGGPGSWDRLVLTGTGGTFTAKGVYEPTIRGIVGGNNVYNATLGDNFQIVSASSVKGGFDSVTQPFISSQNLRFDTIFKPTSLFTVVTPNNFGQFAKTNWLDENSIRFGEALDAARPNAGSNGGGATQSLFEALYGLSNLGYQNVLLQSNGEIHAHALQTVQNNLDSSSNLVLDNGLTSFGDLSAKTHQRALWGDYYNRSTKAKDTQASLGFDDDTQAYALGWNIIDNEDSRVGFAATYSKSEVKTDYLSSADIDNTSVHAYALKKLNKSIALSALVSTGKSKVVTSRGATFADGSINANSRSDITNTRAQLDLRYTVPISENVIGHITGGADATIINADALEETSTSIASRALSLPNHHWFAPNARIGGDIEYKLPNLTFTGFATIVHGLGKDTSAKRIVGLGNINWYDTTVGIKDTGVNFGAKVQGNITPNIELRASYVGTRYGNTYRSDGFNLAIVSKF